MFEKFNEKLVIRCSLNENDENKMRFENLIKQTLQLIKSRSVIIKTRKRNYKTKKTTTLMKKMKSIIKKNVNEHFINLLKAMKSRIEESISKAEIKLHDLIEVMKEMTINVNNLCFFFEWSKQFWIESKLSIAYVFALFFFKSIVHAQLKIILDVFSKHVFSKHVFSKHVDFEYVLRIF